MRYLSILDIFIDKIFMEASKIHNKRASQFIASIRGKLIVRYSLLFGFFSLLLCSIIYFCAQSFLKDDAERSSARALFSMKAIVESSINIAVSNYLRPIVQENEAAIRAELKSSQHLGEHEARAQLFSAFSLAERAQHRHSIESYVAHIDGKVLVSNSRYIANEQLWNEQDANGLYYFQDMASIAHALPKGQIASIQYWKEGQFLVAVFSYIRELEWLLVTISPRNSQAFFSNTAVIRDELVSLKIGDHGSIAIFNDLGMQYVNSAKQFEDSIRITETQRKIMQMKEGSFTRLERYADINSYEYITNSAELATERFISKKYNFTYLPDLQWYLVVGVDLDEIYSPLTLFSIISFTLSILFIFIIVVFTTQINDELIFNSLSVINAALTQFKQGDYSTRLEVNSKDEFSQLSLGFNAMAATIEKQAEGLKLQVTEQDEQSFELEKMTLINCSVVALVDEINASIELGENASVNLEKQLISFKDKIAVGALKKSELIHFLDLSVDSCNVLNSSFNDASKLLASYKFIILAQSSTKVENVNLYSFLNDTFSSLLHEHRSYAVNFSVHCAQSIYISCEPFYLYLVVHHLILNSLQHAFKVNGDNEIQIEVQETAGQLMLTYKDNGPGFEQELLAHIFTPSFIGNKEEGDPAMGLAVVQDVIHNKLQGTIECFNDNGAVFVLCFPSKDQGQNSGEIRLNEE